MPLHDWTRVDAGTFHDFHTTWIVHLKDAMNEDLLPDGYYAMSEQRFGRPIADIPTLRARGSADPRTIPGGDATGLLAPPRPSVRMTVSPTAAYRKARKTPTVRHVSGNRIAAIVEIASPADKDRPQGVVEFVEKLHATLDAGVHLLLIDMLPPGPNDPAGFHGALWDLIDDQAVPPPADRPLTFASYQALALPEAEIEYASVGQPVPDMPVYLDVGLAVGAPLSRSYESAFRAMPAYLRAKIAGGPPPGG